MIHEWGSPTIFLIITLSCADYESPDITTFFRKVNNVPSSYNIGKLCTEDPISRKYQARGASHYHILLWIPDVPVIGHDDPEKILEWIDERITCHIPDEKNNPDLHRFATRYQMHKCSAYCKRRRKCGSNFITRCSFGFPC